MSKKKWYDYLLELNFLVIFHDLHIDFELLYPIRCLYIKF